MFTTVDKAIAAIIGGVLSVLALNFNQTFAWATPELVSAISAVFTTILVYAVPNKPVAPTENTPVG